MLRRTPQMLKNQVSIKEMKWITCNELHVPGIHRLNCPCLRSKTERYKATWRNWWERREACTHCGQVNEYPTLPTIPLPTPLPSKISFHISSWHQFIFVYLILHFFFLIIIIINLCSGMPGCSMFHVPCSMFHVPCSWFYRRPSNYD